MFIFACFSYREKASNAITKLPKAISRANMPMKTEMISKLSFAPPPSYVFRQAGHKVSGGYHPVMGTFLMAFATLIIYHFPRCDSMIFYNSFCIPLNCHQRFFLHVAADPNSVIYGSWKMLLSLAIKTRLNVSKYSGVLWHFCHCAIIGGLPPLYRYRKGVCHNEYSFVILLSVLASVVAYYICKMAGRR